MLEGRTALFVFERDFVVGVMYRNEVLKPYVHLFRGACDSEFILIVDNAMSYRALLDDEFLENEDNRRMEWPDRFLDINPIEHVWDTLGRVNATCNPPPRTIQKKKKRC
ncbi:DDE_3 domain-containing protein [Trichonephila clavipes]|nr:DDE_3 domain-containing protein [Trichonephila clavipes]